MEKQGNYPVILIYGAHDTPIGHSEQLFHRQGHHHLSEVPGNMRCQYQYIREWIGADGNFPRGRVWR